MFPTRKFVPLRRLTVSEAHAQVDMARRLVKQQELKAALLRAKMKLIEVSGTRRGVQSRTGYVLYCEQERQTLRPGLAVPGFVSILSERWNNLSQEERSAWDQRSKNQTLSEIDFLIKKEEKIVKTLKAQLEAERLRKQAQRYEYFSNLTGFAYFLLERPIHQKKEESKREWDALPPAARQAYEEKRQALQPTKGRKNAKPRMVTAPTLFRLDKGRGKDLHQARTYAALPSQTRALYIQKAAAIRASIRERFPDQFKKSTKEVLLDSSAEGDPQTHADAESLRRRCANLRRSAQRSRNGDCLRLLMHHGDKLIRSLHASQQLRFVNSLPVKDKIWLRSRLNAVKAKYPNHEAFTLFRRDSLHLCQEKMSRRFRRRKLLTMWKKLSTFEKEEYVKKARPPTFGQFLEPVPSGVPRSCPLCRFNGSRLSAHANHQHPVESLSVEERDVLLKKTQLVVCTQCGIWVTKGREDYHLKVTCKTLRHHR